jgi:transposase InsO family protein
METGGLTQAKLLKWLGLPKCRFHDWRARNGLPNRHNGSHAKEHWLEGWEVEAIKSYAVEHPDDGYRRLSFMMLDADVVAVSPSSVYRVLKAAGLLNRSQRKPSRKGTGFVQPTRPHEHWHTDITFIRIGASFYCIISVLDGYSRMIIHWELREKMTRQDVMLVIERAREKHPEAKGVRVISDNGSQYTSREFASYMALCGMTHVRTSPYYPQSNGKQERFHQSLKAEGVHPNSPVSKADAERIIGIYVEYYCSVRLHSAIGYVAPRDKLEGREPLIFAQRQRKLDEASKRRAAALLNQTGTPLKKAAGSIE